VLFFQFLHYFFTIKYDLFYVFHKINHIVISFCNLIKHFRIKDLNLDYNILFNKQFIGVVNYQENESMESLSINQLIIVQLILILTI